MESGNRIRQIRNSKNKTMKSIADEVGISIAYLSDIEKGNRNGTKDTIQKIADALDVEIEELMSTDH